MKYTTNYNLNLYELGDNANLADGYNNSMERIDTQLFQIASQLSQLNTSFQTVYNKLASLETRVSNLEASE